MFGWDRCEKKNNWKLRNRLLIVVSIVQLSIRRVVVMTQKRENHRHGLSCGRCTLNMCLMQSRSTAEQLIHFGNSKIEKKTKEKKITTQTPRKWRDSMLIFKRPKETRRTMDIRLGLVCVRKWLELWVDLFMAQTHHGCCVIYARWAGPKWS